MPVKVWYTQSQTREILGHVGWQCNHSKHNISKTQSKLGKDQQYYVTKYEWPARAYSQDVDDEFIHQKDKVNEMAQIRAFLKNGSPGNRTDIEVSEQSECLGLMSTKKCEIMIKLVHICIVYKLYIWKFLFVNYNLFLTVYKVIFDNPILCSQKLCSIWQLHQTALSIKYPVAQNPILLLSIGWPVACELLSCYWSPPCAPSCCLFMQANDCSCYLHMDQQFH
jgi:hypothetical protein